MRTNHQLVVFYIVERNYGCGNYYYGDDSNEEENGGGGRGGRDGGVSGWREVVNVVVEGGG